jgi:arylsulfatase A-like enzyme
MKRPKGLYAALTAGAIVVSCAVPRSLSERPNVIFILADDVGWGDVGAYHQMQTGTAPVVPTPNLDELAAQGMMFTDAHTSAAYCAPTRFSMMTGGNPHRNGRPWGTWSLEQSSAFSANGRHRTVGEVMQAAGYRTAFFGKMHFGGDPKDSNGDTTHDLEQIDFSRPIGDGLLAHGFDYSYGLHSGQQKPPYLFYENDMFAPIDPARPADNSSTMVWSAGVHPNPDGSVSEIPDDESYKVGDLDWDTTKVGNQLSSRAVEFIDDHLRKNRASGQDTPFFMYYSSQAIHVPRTPPNEFNGIPVRGTTINVKTDMIKELDLQVGRIIQKLEDEGLADDTLIIFTSDNGGLPDKGGEGEAGHASTGGLRGFKGGPFEGGTRVPFIAKWGNGTPAGSNIQPGTRSDKLVMAHDWVASLYDLTRQDMPVDQAEDSTSLLPLLFSRQADTDPLRFFALLQSKIDSETAIPHMMRMDDDEGEWMMLLDAGRQPVHLYSLTRDLSQQRDLLSEPAQQDRVTAMRQLFLRHDSKNDPRSTVAFRAADATPFPQATRVQTAAPETP